MDDQSAGSVRIEKLTDANYYVWKHKIQLVLALRDVDQHIFDDIPDELSESDRRAWLRGDRKARAYIGLSLSDDHLEHVRGLESAKDMWEAIVNVFERHTLLNKLAARREFYTVEMLPNEKVLPYINRVKHLAAKLKSMSVHIDDKEMAMAVLNGLPSRFDSLIVALDALGNEDKVFGLDFVKSRLLQEEQRESMKSEGAKTLHGPALVNRAPIRREMKCTNCSRFGHTATYCWGKDVNGRRPPPPSRFRTRNNIQKPSAFVSQQEHSVEEPNEDDYTCLLSNSSAMPSVPTSKWLVDSGCSAHMTFDRSLFITYENMESGSVEMGTKARANVAGRGAVELMLNVNGSANPCILKNVLHVPDFGYSLLSVSQMVSKGMEVSFQTGNCIVTKGSKVLATASLVGDLYILDIQPHTASAHVVSLQTLHERLGHVNAQGVASMIRNNVVSGINVNKNDVKNALNPKSDNPLSICPACVFGKATRSVIPKQRTSPRALHCLDLVHSDVCGPLEVQSVGGSRYFITFVDDHSNWVVVYTMRNKSEAFAKYKLFEKFAETHTGRKVKVLRTDRGGEYLSTQFKSYLDTNGTQHQLTTAYTPQQNGVAERLNRTLIDLVRSMMSHKQVSKQFWAEALATAVHVRNRVTSRALPVDTTPHHIWMKTTPNIGHLRIFGSKCWYTLPKLELRKLDVRAREAMFLGYAQGSKAYKLWDGELNKIIVSRDVKFDESNSGTHDGSQSSNDSVHDDGEVVMLGNDDEDAQNEVDDEAAVKSDESYSESSTDSEGNDNTNTSSNNAEEALSNNEPQIGSSSNPTQAVRRSSRVSKPRTSWWRSNFATLLSHAHVAIEGPKTYKQAMNGPRAAFWQKGIDKELASQAKNKTWTLVPRSEASNILTSRWVFNVKQIPDGSGNTVESPKARLVARGFQQVEGLDYTETYAPVIKFTTIRLLLSLVAHYDLELHQMDVVTAFLNGDLDEDIYMEQPEGCIDENKRDCVCKLAKALYGLKQAHRQWHAKVDDFLIGELGFETSRSDPCLYIKRVQNTIMLVALYVDDLLLAGSHLDAITWIKGELNKRFEMKDLGEAKVCIGLEIHRSRGTKTLSLTQSKYASNVLDRFRMKSCNPTSTPMEQVRQAIVTDMKDSETSAPYRQAIGCLMYLMVGTRPDLAYAIGKLSQRNADPHESDWVAVKRVMRYLRGTQNLGIVFSNTSEPPVLLGYSDADWAGCHESRKSTSGYVFKFCGGAISWSSRKQTVVATSTCEAEYTALSEACKEATWLRQVVADVLGSQNDPTITIGCDNAGTIAFAHNQSITRRNKHVDVKYHFVRDATTRGVVSLVHCPTAEMPADILTKPLGRILFEKGVKLLGLAVRSQSM